MDIGFLEKDYSSEWACMPPAFAIPKKNGRIKVTIRVVNGIRF
jgi:hypothetical protein